MIRTKQLTKEYKNKTVVKNLNLEIEKGEAYGLLGQNGAGKTTTILMILGIVKPTVGEVILFGKHLEDDYFGIKRKIGVASEEKSLYYEMSAENYLCFFADLYGVRNKYGRIEKILKALNLYERKDERIKVYSKGMKQKIEVARALVHDPEILILDEPASGLDPVGINNVRNVILEEKQKGKTILISSHILSEIEKICDRVGIINNGNLVLEDKLDNLRHRLSNTIELEVELDIPPDNELINRLSALTFAYKVIGERNKLLIKMDTREDYRIQISKIVSSYGAVILGMKKKENSLEDVFMTTIK